MDERDANIDLVFRNGFKNLEVLPPPVVWDNIKPVLRKNERSGIIFRRMVAGIALFIVAGILLQQIDRRQSPMLIVNRSSPLNQGQIPLVEIIPDNVNTAIAVNSNPVFPVAEAAVSESAGSNYIDQATISRIDNLPIEKDLNIAPGMYGNNLRIQSPVKKNVNFYATDVFIEDPFSGILSSGKPLEPTDRWAITAMASPTYFSQFRFGKNEVALQMMESEQPMVSYSGGLALSYNINKRVSVQSGVFYSSVGQEIKGIASFGGFRKYDNTKGSRNFEVMTSIGVVYTDNADVFLVDQAADRMVTQFTSNVFDPGKADLDYLDNSLKQNYSYLELPVFLRYKVIDKSIDINLIGGLSYNFLVNNSVYTMDQGSRYSVGKTEGLSIMSFSSSLGMGMEYSFTKNASFNLEPTFRYYLNPFRDIEGSGIHPYSFGIFSGVSIRF